MKLQPQVNRAQLLYAWKTHDNPSLLAQTAELFGYQPSEAYLKRLLEPQQAKGAYATSEQEIISPSEQQQTEWTESEQQRSRVAYYYLARRERYATEEQAQQEIPDIFAKADSISSEELTSFWHDYSSDSVSPLQPTPLTQPRSMTPFIRRSLRQEVGRRLDLKTLVHQVAQQKQLNVLPTEPRLLPAGRVTILADLNKRLLPFWKDIQEACALIKQKHGKIGLDLRVLAQDQPQADFYDYDDWLKRKLRTRSWQKIPPQSLVMILSDLGQLSPENSLIRQHWLQFVTQLNRRGITPLVLAPIAAEQQCPLIQAKTQLMLWQRFGQLKKQKAQGNKVHYQQQVERVLGFLSLSPHIESSLLRTFCELLSQSEGQTGIEAGIYLHPDVQWGYTAITLKTEVREYYQKQFQHEEPALKQQVLDCIGQCHSRQFASVWAESILNAEKLMVVDPELVAKAEEVMLRIAKSYHSNCGHDGMMRFARRHLSRLNKEQRQQKPYAAAFWGLAHREELQRGEAIPKEYDTELVNQVLREPAEKQHYYLNQIGERLLISHQQQGFGQCLAEFITLQNTIIVNQQVFDLPAINDLSIKLEELEIDTGQEKLTLLPIHKPKWAKEMFMRDGVPFAVLSFGSQLYELSPELNAQDYQSLRFATKKNEAVLLATVTEVGCNSVTIDLKDESTSVLPIAQFKNEAGEMMVLPGNTVEVALRSVEYNSGEIRFFHNKAGLSRLRVWDDLDEAFNNDKIVTGIITGKVKGGFVVELGGVFAFLPGSLVDVRPLRDPTYLEGKELEFKLIKLDQKRNNVVVSRRAAIEEEYGAGREALLDSIQEGQTVKGVVKNLTDYGAFLDLGGLDGLLHIVDMSWKRVKHPSEVVSIGDEIDVKVLKFDKDKNRISLGLKQLNEDPWRNLVHRHPKGTRLFGKVTTITEYGPFVEIEDGIDGLVHVSDMSWADKNPNPAEVVTSGDEVEVMILEIDADRRRIMLGMKQCQTNPHK